MMKHQGKCVIFITGQMYNIEKNSQFYVLGRGFSNVYQTVQFNKQVWTITFCTASVF